MSKNELPEQRSTVFNTRGHEIMAISATLYIILLSATSLLIYTRMRLRCSLNTNGILALLAMIPTSLYFVATLVTNDDFHWNRHQSDIPTSHLKNGFILAFFSEIVFTVAITLAKLSLMMLIQQITTRPSALRRGLTKLVVVIVVVQGAISCFLVVFQCGHPQYFWSSSSAKRQECLTSKNHLASGIMSSSTDLIILALLIPSLLSFKLKAQRPVIFIIFILGIFSIAAGIARTYYLARSLPSKSKDFIWSYYPVWIASALQLYLGMLSNTLPPTTPFFTKYFPSQYFPPPSTTILPTSAHKNDEFPLSNSQHAFSLTSSRRNKSLNASTNASVRSRGDEELHGFDFEFEKVGRAGVNTATVESNTRAVLTGMPAEQEREEREFIKITQQTVVHIGRAGDD